MGHVYRARDPRLGRHVAIKTLPAAMVADEVSARRFESEARTAGALDHPNLLVVYDVGRSDASRTSSRNCWRASIPRAAAAPEPPAAAPGY